MCHMSAEIDGSLSMWNTWLPGFRALANLLHHEHRRKQLVGLCVKSTPFEWITHLFDYGVIRSATWRWGAVTKILPDILSRKFALQAVWDERRFLSGGLG